MKDQRGVLLLLALVSTSVVLTAALILSTIIIRQTKIATTVVNGEIAFFTAETKAEEAAFEVFKVGTEPATLSGSGVTGNGATWNRTVTDTVDQLIFDFIPAGQSVVFNIFNKANANQAAGVESIVVAQTSGNTISVDLKTWDGVALSGSSSAGTFACCADAIIDAVNAANAYEVTITANSSAATDVVVSFFAGAGGSGGAASVSSTIQVISNGVFRNSNQSVQFASAIRAPWLSGGGGTGGGGGGGGGGAGGGPQVPAAMNIGASPLSGSVPLLVNFNAVIVDPNPDQWTLSVSKDSGSGQVGVFSDGPTPTKNHAFNHTFTDPGTYIIRGLVDDGVNGGVDSNQLTITVNP